jgi:2-oxoglutarate ferredoxin oxidoreductase subunit alpha
VNTAGLLLGELLAQKGYTIWADKEYASIIKGDNNSFFLSISSEHEMKLSKKIDLFFAFDNFAIQKNQEIYQLEHLIEFKGVTATHINMFAFGACLKIVNISLEEGEKIMKDSTAENSREGNMIDLQAGYAYAKEQYAHLCHTINLSEKRGGEKKLMFGNQLLGEGAIAAGLEFYSAYPMTPTTSLIDVIVEHPEVTFFQGEDEIAVAMAMLGARFAGKRAMCGTSGGGFALMSESVSFSHQSEIGGVYVVGQRDGPSTGSPTFTAQGDLSFVMNSGFGETTPAVLAPSTFEETYSMISQALNQSDMYQHPLVFLIDKQLAEGYKTISERDLTTVPINRGIRADSEAEDTYLRYKVTSDGISPYAIPGQENTVFIATSYEHDEAGATNEDPAIKDEQMQKRFRKRVTFYAKEVMNDPATYEIINPQAEKFFVTRGINRYNLEILIKERSDWGLIVIKVFHPFAISLIDFFRNHEQQITKLVFVEMNYEGQMERFIRRECGLMSPQWEEKISHFRKYTLYPIFIEELLPLLQS